MEARARAHPAAGGWQPPAGRATAHPGMGQRAGLRARPSQAAWGGLDWGQALAGIGHPRDCALPCLATLLASAMPWDSHQHCAHLARHRPATGVGRRWQHPLSQAPTMSGWLLLLAVLPTLLGPPAATAQKRSQGGC